YFPFLFGFPFVVSFFGLQQTVGNIPGKRWEEVHLKYPSPRGKVANLPKLQRLSPLSPDDSEKYPRKLRVAQITDPHLGPIMPIERLYELCQHIISLEPDLILLTGIYILKLKTKG